jgi:hypothetical protein
MDQLYIEEGYIDASYYGKVAEAVAIINSFANTGTPNQGVLTASIDVEIADATGYYIEGYIEVGYVETTEFTGVVKEFVVAMTAFGDITMTVSVVKNQTATIDAVTNMSATVSKVAGNIITLESIINQSMMDDAPRIRFFTFSTNASDPLNVDFTTLRSTIFIDVTRIDVFRTTDVTLDSVASLETTPTKTTDINLSLEATTTQDVDAFNVTFLDALTLTTNVTSNVAIEKFISDRQFGRPNNWYTSDSSPIYTTEASYASAPSGRMATFYNTKTYYNDADIYVNQANRINSTGFAGTFWYQINRRPEYRNAQVEVLRYGKGTNPYITVKEFSGTDIYNNYEYYSTPGISVRLSDGSTVDINAGRSAGTPDNARIPYGYSGNLGYPNGYAQTQVQITVNVIASDDQDYIKMFVVLLNLDGSTRRSFEVVKFLGVGKTLAIPPVNERGFVVTNSVGVSFDEMSWRTISNESERQAFGSLGFNQNSTWNTISNTTNTIVYTSFDDVNDPGADTVGLTKQFNFSGNTVSSFLAVPNAKLDGDTIHLGTFGISIDANIIAEPRAQLLSDFAVYADPIVVVTMLPADLAVSSTATITAGGQTNVDANIASQATVTVDAIRVRTANITTESIATAINVINFIGNTLTEFTPGVFNTTIDADRLRGIDDNLETIVSATIAAGKTPKFDSTNFETAFTVDADISYRPFVFMDKGALALLTVDANITRDNDAVLVSTAALEAATSGLLPGNAILSVNANLTVIPSVTRTFDGAFDTTTFLNAEGIKAVTGETILASAFITTTDNSRIRDVNTQFDSIATDISTAVKIGDFLITLESAFTTVTNAGFNASATATINAASIIEITAERLRGIEAASNAESTLSATGRFTSDAALDAFMASALTADAVRIADANAILTDAMTFASTVRATRNNEVSVYSESSMNVVNGRVRNSQASVTSQASIQVDASTRVGIIAQLDSAFEITADGKEIHILEIVYTIPRENRTFRISKETRTYQVQFENREYTLGD